MENVARVLYSKKVNLFMIYFSVFAFAFFAVYTIETLINEKALIFTFSFLFFALLALNAIRVSWKRYKLVK